MPLTPLTDRAEIAAAFEALVQSLRAGGHVSQCFVGYQGGGMELELFWHPQHQLWVGFQELENRYWCAFGTTEPVPSIGITCEINIPLEDFNRRVAGVLARDEEGRVFLLHSGRVGGGRRGIGKSEFLRYFGPSPRATVRWPDARQTELIPLGELGSPDLLPRVAHFVHLVERFKLQAASAGGEGTGEPDYEDTGLPSLDEDGILIAAALRFDGYKFQERHNLDYRGVVRHFLDTGRWPEASEAQLATLFMMQRFLYKWGGETEPRYGGYWRAFRSLFLHTYWYATPDEYRGGQMADRWDSEYRPRLDAAVEVIRRIHEQTRYDDNAEPEGPW